MIKSYCWSHEPVIISTMMLSLCIQQGSFNVTSSNDHPNPPINKSAKFPTLPGNSSIIPGIRLRYSRSQGWEPSMNVAYPEFSCDETTNCSDKYDTNLPLECRDGLCRCKVPLCWIYTYEKHGFFSEFIFTCGKCGQLGSECGNRYSVSCDEPGYCALDGFCHCDRGEHKEDICVVFHTNALLQFLMGGLIVFLFLAAAAVMYQTFLSYRHYGTICWCRNRYRRRRRRRNNQQSRTSSRRVEKSPAFTIQQRIMQSFHDEDDEDELSEEEMKSNQRSSNDPLSSKDEKMSENTIAEFKATLAKVIGTNGKNNESTTDNSSCSPPEDIPLKSVKDLSHPKDSYKNTLPRNEVSLELKNRSDHSLSTVNNDALSSSELKVVEDTTGMTDYYNQYQISKL